ncbi:hypothetical protein [uncultured Rikenella sp.]|nr:hypothetical protein [uncultured Rikenella sp.]
MGNYGYSWSSAVNGTYCVFLLFRSTELGPSYVHYRGYSYQLRCLSE